MAPLEGPVGVGALVDAIMLGCLIVQSCVYYKNSRSDTWLLKVLVLLILLLLLSHLSCMAVWLWASTEGNARHASLPNYATTLFGVSGICGAVITFLERCFLSHRILKSSNNHLLAFVFFASCIFSFMSALGAATVFFTSGTADLTKQLLSHWTFPLVIISGLSCDLAISIVTGFYLVSRTPMDAVHALGYVTHLLLFAAETGAVASFFGIATVVVYWSTKTNFAWVGLIVCMPGVFANTLLASLNVREKLCVDIKHQRAGDSADKLIDGRPKKPPILIAISKRVERQPEKSPV